MEMTKEGATEYFKKFDAGTLVSKTALTIFYKNTPESPIEYKTSIYVTISPSNVVLHKTKIE